MLFGFGLIDLSDMERRFFTGFDSGKPYPFIYLQIDNGGGIFLHSLLWCHPPTTTVNDNISGRESCHSVIPVDCKHNQCFFYICWGYARATINFILEYSYRQVGLYHCRPCLVLKASKYLQWKLFQRTLSEIIGYHNRLPYNRFSTS